MTSMMFEFKPTLSDSDSDYDIPVPDIARSADRRDRRRADIEHLVGMTNEDSTSLASPSIAAATAAEILQARNSPLADSRRFSTRPLGAIEIQQLAVGELSAALLCSPTLGVHLSSMASSTSSATGQPSSGAVTGTGSTTQGSGKTMEGVRIKASGRSFRTNSVHMRDLMKRKALTLPQTVRYDEKADIYYVDCSAEVFEEIFDFFRTGDLHLPKKVCIEKSLREMRRLNVFPNMLAPCCFARYDRFRAQKEAMKIWYEQLVKDPTEEANNSPTGEHPEKKVPIRLQVWNFLENPFSSKFATIYSWITIIMVALSIAGFIIETLPQIDVLLNNYKFVRHFGDLVSLCERLANPQSASLMGLNGSNTTNSSDSSPFSEEIVLETPAPPTPGPCPITYDVKSDRFTMAAASNKGPFGELNPTVGECYAATTLWFIDYFAAAFFTLDLLVRFFVSPNKIQFFKSRLNLIDALALVPFYVELVFSILTRMAYNQMWEVLEVFRSLRLLRIFRLAKWNYGLNVLYYTARAIVGPMSTLLTICIIGILFFGTIMYYVDARDRFTSIPISIYWAAITMTTVGYGDITPKSGQGCFIAALCASCGILVIGFVLPIVTSKFMFYYQHIKMGRYYKKMVRRSVASSSSVASLEITSKSQHQQQQQNASQRRATVSGGETESLLTTVGPTLSQQSRSLAPPPVITTAPVSASLSLSTQPSSDISNSEPGNSTISTFSNNNNSFRKSASSSTGDESLLLQPIPENHQVLPLIVESDMSSVDFLEPPMKTPRSERDPFIPSVNKELADESDYRMWNGKIDSVH